MRVDVAVVGGGITGLTAAWALQRAGVGVVLLEATARTGGMIGTTRERGFLAESGPNSLVGGATLDRLVGALGLGDQLVAAGGGGRRRYVVRGGVPHAIPESPLAAVRTPLLSARGKLRALCEPLVRAEAREDESVASFVRRRLGREVLDWLVNPFVAGVYAGDPERLGVAHAFPALHALERDHGGLLRGMLARRRARRDAGTPAPGMPQSVSFRDGLDTLPRALAAELGDAVRLDAPVRAVQRQGDGWRLAVGPIGRTEVVDCDAIVWTAPAHAMSRVDWPESARPAVGTMAELRYPAVTALTLGFRREHVAHPLDGFGMLVPAVEPFAILGALFTSSLFPHRAPPGHVTVTCFIGGSRRPELGAASVEAVRALALADLHRLLGVRGEPVWTSHTAWAQAIPQYEVAHGRVREAARSLEDRHDGLFVAGQAVEGISLGDCLAAGERVAARVAARHARGAEPVPAASAALPAWRAPALAGAGTPPPGG